MRRGAIGSKGGRRGGRGGGVGGAEGLIGRRFEPRLWLSCGVSIQTGYLFVMPCFFNAALSHVCKCIYT